MRRLLSRKFLAAVLLVLFAVSGYATAQLSYEQAMELVKVAVVGYLAAEGAGDAAARLGSRT